MSKLSYDSVDVLIYDPVPANRAASRAAMYSLGFRRTVNVATLEDFVETIRKAPPDIALCEASGSGEKLCRAIQQVRQGEAGGNPFIVIIVTAWNKASGLISRVVSSGADDLLLRPFSTATLGARIESHVARRKGFIVTTDYVGPDRRRENERLDNTDAELFAPPNSLRMKAWDRLSDELVTRRMENELREAQNKLQYEKLRQDSFQVCVLWRLLQERPPDAASDDLEKLIGLARSIEARCRDTAFQPAVEWCESVAAAAEGLRLAVDRNASMHLLGHAALSLNQVFYPEKNSARQLSEIDAAVTRIRIRNQAQDVVVPCNEPKAVGSDQ
jgi:DNA-binding response OmpR family regulator